MVEEDQFGVIFALQLFPSEVAKILPEKAAECEARKLLDRKASLAVLGLNLGVDTVAEEMCRIQQESDSQKRALMISEIGDWDGSIAEFYRCASTTANPDLKSGLLLGVSKHPKASLKSVEVSKWIQLAETEYRSSSSCVVHAAAMYFLKNWGLLSLSLNSGPAMASGLRISMVKPSVGFRFIDQTRRVLRRMRMSQFM